MTLWAVPAAVLAVGVLPLFLAVRRAMAEAAALRDELAQLAGLRGAVQALGVELRHLQREILTRREARPAGPRVS